MSWSTFSLIKESQISKVMWQVDLNMCSITVFTEKLLLDQHLTPCFQVKRANLLQETISQGL